MSDLKNVKVGTVLVGEPIGLGHVSAGMRDMVTVTKVTVSMRSFEVDKWKDLSFRMADGKSMEWRYYKIRRARPHELKKLRQQARDIENRKFVIAAAEAADSVELQKIRDYIEDRGMVW